MDHVGGVAGAGQRHRQRVDDQDRVLAGRGVPADDPAVEQIPHPGQVKLALPGGELGDVSDPRDVGSVGDEVAVEPIGFARGVGPATPPLLAGMCSDHAVRGHQPGDTPTRHAGPEPSELALHTRGSIRATRPLMDLSDRFEQISIRKLTRRRDAMRPRVERRARHLDEFTHPLDRQVDLVVLDEAQADQRIVSRAK